MKIGPKYKIARRLKSPIFEKTQTQKYALREERKFRRKFSRAKSDYAKQLEEKQKARMFYAVTEKQFRKYVKEALTKSGTPSENLLQSLESRLDNAVWRAGILPTHLSARQAVAHGHFLVNGKRVYVPSIKVKDGDIISVRSGSQDSKLFTKDPENDPLTSAPAWLVWNPKTFELTVKKGAGSEKNEELFDLGQVIEYYQR